MTVKKVPQRVSHNPSCQLTCPEKVKREKRLPVPVFTQTQLVELQDAEEDELPQLAKDWKVGYQTRFFLAYCVVCPNSKMQKS